MTESSVSEFSFDLCRSERHGRFTFVVHCNDTPMFLTFIVLLNLKKKRNLSEKM